MQLDVDDSITYLDPHLAAPGAAVGVMCPVRLHRLVTLRLPSTNQPRSDCSVRRQSHGFGCQRTVRGVLVTE
jgi:hypothetical protein